MIELNPLKKNWLGKLLVLNKASLKLNNQRYLSSLSNPHFMQYEFFALASGLSHYSMDMIELFFTCILVDKKLS